MSSQTTISAKGVALITGASQGIGRAIAIRLANDGFDVAVNDLPTKAQALTALVYEINKIGRKSEVILADVAVEAEVKAMVDKTVEVLGGLNVMVANAGISWTKSFEEASLEDLNHVFSINVGGVFSCYKYAAMQMVKQGKGGRIIGASSMAGKRAIGYTSAYCASKFAVIGLTQSAASEFGRHNITVNAYAPGVIETPMSNDAMKNPALLDDNLGRAPLPNGIGQPEDVANVVSFLASEESRFITGQTISVNGGRLFG